MTELVGWQYLLYDELGSTNDEAKHFCQIPEQRIVVRAKIQTCGRGRRGRTWISEAGNLFFSLVFEFDIKNIGSLVLISALSIAQTVEKFSPQSNVKLKWPNDVLLENAKLSGILLEKGENNYIIVGIGINIISSPENKELLYKATSLSEENIVCSPEEFLNGFLLEFNRNLDLIKNNKNQKLREEWLRRAAGLEEEVIIKQDNKTARGIFIGIDENMSLLLKQNNNITKFVVGDVFLKKDIVNDGI